MFLILSQALLRVLFYLCNLFVNDQLSATLCVHLFYFIISAPCFYNLAATMIFEAEVSMTRQLDFNDVHSDVESIAPIIPARECTTPQKSFSIPFCVSVMQLCTFNTFFRRGVLIDIYHVCCRGHLILQIVTTP